MAVVEHGPHLFLIGFRNRIVVALNWFWSYVTLQRGTRLITGISGSRIEDVMPAVMTVPSSFDVAEPVSGQESTVQSYKKLHQQQSLQDA